MLSIHFETAGTRSDDERAVGFLKIRRRKVSDLLTKAR